MEYVDGGTLEKYCSAEALPSVERALEFAHKLGVTHRETDVKIMANLRLSGV